MTWGSRSGRAAVWAVAVWVLAIGAGCGREAEQPGRAELQVSLAQGLAAADVTRVLVEVRGPGISPPLSEELVKSGGTWQGTVAGIPAGTARVIEGRAYNASGVLLYQGSSAPLSIVSGGTASVLLTLQPVEVVPPYENEPPRIDSVVASANTVLPNKSITLTVTAHDPNGDTLSYAWTAPAGTFSAPAAPNTTWTAPATEGVRRLRLEVTDSRGTSVSVEFDVAVQVDGATGSAQVTVGFNHWPRVTALRATPAVLELGKPVQLSAVASDTDGQPLSYAWTSDCAGTFSASSAASTRFSLGSAPASGRCALKVTVSDGAGGQHTGTLMMRLGSAPQVNVAPKIDNFWQSATVADGGQLVTVGVAAHDPEGKPLTFGWSAFSGTVESTRWTSGSGEADWRLPTCFDGPVTLSASVHDADGAVVQHVFSVAPSASAKCAPTTVYGVRRVMNVQQDGSVIVTPFNLSAVTIGAWVPTADGSAYEYQAGTGSTNGTFTVPGVVRLPYLLRYGTAHYWMTSRNVDLGNARLGRPDVETEPEGTQLVLSLIGVSPWQAEDDVQLHSPGAGIGYQSLGCNISEIEIPLGATDLSVTMDYVPYMQNCGNSNAPRIAPWRGDTVYGSQLVGRTSTAGGVEVTYAEARRGGILSVSGLPGEVHVNGALAPLSVSPQRFDFKASQFESLMLGIHADARLSYKIVNVGTLLRFNDFGQYAGYPDLAIASNYTSGQGDYAVEMAYGNPYPSAWPRMVTTTAAVSVPFSLPLEGGGTTTPARYATDMYTQELLRDGEFQSLTPRVGPPRAPRLNGLDASGSLSGVGSTPLLSWTEPSLGTAVRYQLRLYELSATSWGSTTRTQRANFVTTQTQVRLPPGLLVPGRSYFFQMYAYAIPGYDPDKPFRNGAEYAFATRFSGVFSP